MSSEVFIGGNESAVRRELDETVTDSNLTEEAPKTENNSSDNNASSRDEEKTHGDKERKNNNDDGDDKDINSRSIDGSGKDEEKRSRRKKRTRDYSDDNEEEPRVATTPPLTDSEKLTVIASPKKKKRSIDQLDKAESKKDVSEGAPSEQKPTTGEEEREAKRHCDASQEEKMKKKELEEKKPEEKESAEKEPGKKEEKEFGEKELQEKEMKEKEAKDVESKVCLFRLSMLGLLDVADLLSEPHQERLFKYIDRITIRLSHYLRTAATVRDEREGWRIGKKEFHHILFSIRLVRSGCICRV